MHKAKKQIVVTMIIMAISLLVTDWGTTHTLAQSAEMQTDPDLKVAFVADSGKGNNAENVLHLILAEEAEIVIHSGDMAYGSEDVAAANEWHEMVVRILGSDFPYFGSMGNHDDTAWVQPDGYQDLLEAQATRAGAVCTGNYGLNSTCTYRGLEFILSEGGNAGFTTSEENEQYLRDQFSNSNYIWKICSWHHNQSAMQVGGKGNATGWGVYEACLEAGAIVVTGHEHSYARTKTLISMENQTVDPIQHPVDSDGVPQYPDSLIVYPGRSFAVVSGLGGASIRDQERCLPFDYPYGCHYEWARIATINQPNTNFGALFITFHVDGNPYKARGEFKTVAGNVLDSFVITYSLPPTAVRIDAVKLKSHQPDSLASTFLLAALSVFALCTFLIIRN